MSIPFYGGSLDPNQYNPYSPSARAAKEKKPKKKPKTKTKAPAAPLGPVTAAPAPDPVATLPDTSYGTQITGDAIAEFGGLPELAGEKKEKERIATRKEEQKNLGLLFKGRGGRPYSFPEPTGPQKSTEVYPVGSEEDHAAGLTGLKFPMSKEQFNALSTQQRMEADVELAKLGADRSKMILPTQADVNLYQSREGKGAKLGAPEYRLNLGDRPRNYVDSARPNEGRWIDPQTGDQYNVNEYSGRQLRQRMPHLVRPEEMDRMMGAGIAPEFTASKGSEGPDLDKYQKFRERLAASNLTEEQKRAVLADPTPEGGGESYGGVMRDVEEFAPPEGVDREAGLKQLDERAAEQTRGQQRDAGQTVKREGQRDLPGKFKHEEPYFGAHGDPENRPSPEEIVAAGPSGLAKRELMRRAEKVRQAEALREMGLEASAKGDHESAVASLNEALSTLPAGFAFAETRRALETHLARVLAESVPDAAERLEEGGGRDLPPPDTFEDEGEDYPDVKLDPEDVAAFVEASENPLDPATAAYEALDDEDIVARSFEEAVESGLAAEPAAESPAAEEPAAAAEPEGPITTGADMTVEEAIPFFSAIYGRDYIDNKSGVVLPASEALMTDFLKLLSRMPAGLTIADVLENMNR